MRSLQASPIQLAGRQVYIEERRPNSSGVVARGGGGSMAIFFSYVVIVLIIIFFLISQVYDHVYLNSIKKILVF